MRCKSYADAIEDETARWFRRRWRAKSFDWPGGLTRADKGDFDEVFVGLEESIRGTMSPVPQLVMEQLSGWSELRSIFGRGQ